MPEGIECHMVPLMNRACLEGGCVGLNAYVPAFFCECICVTTAPKREDVSSSFRYNIWKFMCVLECKTDCVCVCVFVYSKVGHRVEWEGKGGSQFPFAS